MKKRRTYLFIISLIIPSSMVFSQAESELNDSLTIKNKLLEREKLNIRSKIVSLRFQTN